jgi:hypothetical protein
MQELLAAARCLASPAASGADGRRWSVVPSRMVIATFPP